MPKEFKLPDLGEGLTEAEIVSVLVAEGDEITEDQPILVVETEKAQVELPSPFGGRVARIHVRAGERVKVGAVLFTFGEVGGARVARPAAVAAPAPAAAQPAMAKPAASPAVAAAPLTGLPPAATPATRRVARELGVDLRGVAGTGPGGRITDADVRVAAGRAPAAARPTGAPRAAAVPRAGPAVAEPAEPGRPLSLHAELSPLPRFEQWGPVEREVLHGVRRRSAEHLALAWAVIPHVTQHDEADITDVEALRRRHQGLGERWGGDLTLTVLLVKAAAVVLKAYPRFNASLDHERGELVLKRYYHVGVAVDTERGLIVPVLRDVDGKRVRELAVELTQLVARTREGKATLDDLRGGTFTITNTGALGGTGATPIINYPEVAILGVGRAREMPAVRDGAVVIRRILPLSLAFDHRVIDGMAAARFLTDLVRLLEDPERLLLES